MLYFRPADPVLGTRAGSVHFLIRTYKVFADYDIAEPTTHLIALTLALRGCRKTSASHTHANPRPRYATSAKMLLLCFYVAAGRRILQSQQCNVSRSYSRANALAIRLAVTKTAAYQTPCSFSLNQAVRSHLEARLSTHRNGLVLTLVDRLSAVP
ncbi:hypothetical protein PHLGIDRAFT_270754 [Phlebiopsis gigantea 11061_1 CR5-6]|uniref:Uncharacterized protein n=1 Tax=Phlebiopsis gigantea (strain 11061_1 CR5-6) TaxID=745531 RepID=A0A0C3PCQ0_PHLG1|nr:hypothetical protein PHLGIDRAFT_270754 [Phlebiopsis gigantea 11061_1 CR5-6]